MTIPHGLITRLERLGSNTGSAAETLRQRITDQFTQRYNQAKEPQAELDAIEAAQPASRTSPARRSVLPRRALRRGTRGPQ